MLNLTWLQMILCTIGITLQIAAAVHCARRIRRAAPVPVLVAAVEPSPKRSRDSCSWTPPLPPKTVLPIRAFTHRGENSGPISPEERAAAQIRASLLTKTEKVFFVR